MKIHIRNDEVVVDGYVNAIERWSKPLYSPTGKFIERVKEGAFKKALERNDNVLALLNHDMNHQIGSQADKSLTLSEDTIGLRAHLVSTDKDVIEKAKSNSFTGWSFGFRDTSGGVEIGEKDGLTTREISDLELVEVSLLDENASPAYKGTLVSVRDSQGYVEVRMQAADIEIDDQTTKQPQEDEEKQQRAMDKINLLQKIIQIEKEL